MSPVFAFPCNRDLRLHNNHDKKRRKENDAVDQQRAKHQ